MQTQPAFSSIHTLRLLFAVIALRSSSFFSELIDPDEAHFLVIARMLFHKGIPYVDVVDKKPILTYLFYAPAGYLGFSMIPMKLIGIGWVLATSLILSRAATVWTGSARIGHTAAWLYIVISSCNNLCISSELMMNLPVAAALYFFLRSQRSAQVADLAWTGLCIGISSLFRHQAGIVFVALAPVVFFLAYRNSMARACLSLATLGAAALAPWLIASAIYAQLGHFAEFYDWNIARNFVYVVTAASEGGALRFCRSFALYVLLGAPVPWVIALREGLRPFEPIRLSLWLCLCLTWIPVTMGGRYWSVYFLQFSVPLALLSAPYTDSLRERWAGFSKPYRFGLAFGYLLPVAVYVVSGFFRVFSPLFPYPSQSPKEVALGQWIAARTQPDDRIVVWGYVPPIFTLAKRLPGTRYITTAVHFGDIEPSHISADFQPARHLSERDIRNTIQDLERNRPAMIIDTAHADIHQWKPFSLATIPELYDYVLANYTLSESPEGAYVYMRKK